MAVMRTEAAELRPKAGLRMLESVSAEGDVVGAVFHSLASQHAPAIPAVLDASLLIVTGAYADSDSAVPRRHEQESRLN